MTQKTRTTREPQQSPAPQALPTAEKRTRKATRSRKRPDAAAEAGKSAAQPKSRVSVGSEGQPEARDASGSERSERTPPRRSRPSNESVAGNRASQQSESITDSQTQAQPPGGASNIAQRATSKKTRPKAAVVRPAEPRTDKRPFEIEVAVQRLRKAVAPFPKAALFQLFQEGFTSVFEQMVACLISVRTYDEVTLVVARQLFGLARTPAEMLRFVPLKIAALIEGSTFPEPKAQQIHDIARLAVDQLNGVLPGDPEFLQSLRGVGPKCANLVAGIAAGVPSISVDIHVHRITNRWGAVRTSTPEKTMVALEHILPRPYWIEINALLVPFGKHVCTGSRPKCSTCPLLEMCQQVGVENPR